MKNIPIMKKKVKEIINEMNMTPAEALAALEPICEILRKKSRLAVEQEVAEFKKTKGIPRIKTDY